MNKVKHIAKKEEEPDIHFEFYSALPNMQVKVEDFNTPEENQIKKKKLEKIKLASKESKKAELLAMKSTISNAADLEADLSAQLAKGKETLTKSQLSKGPTT